MSGRMVGPAKEGSDGSADTACDGVRGRPAGGWRTGASQHDRAVRLQRSRHLERHADAGRLEEPPHVSDPRGEGRRRRRRELAGGRPVADLVQDSRHRQGRLRGQHGEDADGRSEPRARQVALRPDPHDHDAGRSRRLGVPAELLKVSMKIARRFAIVFAAILLVRAPRPAAAQELSADAKAKEAAEARAKRNALTFENQATTLALNDRAGKRVGTLGERAMYSETVMSPDRSRVAVVIQDLPNESADLFVLDVAGGGKTRLTTSARTEFVMAPVWS